MRDYIVTGLKATFNPPDRMRLTDDQARRRRHLIKKVDDTENVYELLARVEFKNGEVFGYNGEVNKLMVSVMAEVVPEEPEAVLAVDVQKDGAEVALEPVDDPGTGEPMEEVADLSDDTPEDDGADLSCTNDQCDMYNPDNTCGDEDGPEGCENRGQVDELSDLTKKQIKEKLKERKLPTAGNKDEMLQRLKDAIEAEASDAGGEE